MEADTLEIVKLSLAPLSALITWGGVIVLLLVLRNLIKHAASTLLAERIMTAPPEQQRTFIRFLIGSEMTVDELVAQHNSRTKRR